MERAELVVAGGSTLASADGIERVIARIRARDPHTAVVHHDLSAVAQGVVRRRLRPRESDQVTVQTRIPTTPGGPVVKPGIHPDCHPVVFQDRSNGDAFLTRPTATSSQTIERTDGHRYPLIAVDISAASHPFWTGRQRVLDQAGQVEKFRRRYGARPDRSEAQC